MVGMINPGTKVRANFNATPPNKVEPAEEVAFEAEPASSMSTVDAKGGDNIAPIQDLSACG